MRPHAFPRALRLKRRRLIRPLFDRARPDVGRVRVRTVLVLYRLVARTEMPVSVPYQVGFAPGRRRTNVMRTRVRRHLREAFRRHQGPLQAQLEKAERSLTAMILYHGDEQAVSAAIRRDLPEALDRVSRRLAAELSTGGSPPSPVTSAA